MPVALHSSDSSTNYLWHAGTNVPVQAGRLAADLCSNLLSDGVDRFAKSLRLADEGELCGRLIETADVAREDLVMRARSSADPQEGGTIDHAISSFRRRGATRADKRSAVVSLAGILEPLRKTVLEVHLKDAEKDLFNIANNFHLRHNRVSDKKDYDDLYLDWLFWWYLATVEMVQSIVADQKLHGGRS